MEVKNLNQANLDQMVNLKNMIDLNKDGIVDNMEINSLLGVYLKLIGRKSLYKEEVDLFRREIESGQEGIISKRLKELLVKNNYDSERFQREAMSSYFVEWSKKIYLVNIPQKYIDYFENQVDADKNKILSDQELYNKTGIVLNNGWVAHGMQYIQDLKRNLRGVNIKPNRRIINSYKEIIKEMQDLARKYPDKVKLEVIGETYNKRKIVVMKISKDINNDDKQKASILINGLAHAREWATAPAALEIARDILKNPNSELAKYLDKIDVYVLPVLNPDGYEWSLNHDAWWRKNRTKRKDYGVDLNRNYYTDKDPTLYRLPEDSPKGIDDDKGASDDPANIQYRGPYGNSEKEVRAVINFVKDNKIDVVIDLHSFGNMILYPYPLKDKVSKWDAIYKEVGNQISKELKNKFTVIKEDNLYFTTGGSSDYYDANGIFSYTVELGKNFFVNNKKDLNKILNHTKIITKVLLENMANGKIPTKLHTI